MSCQSENNKIHLISDMFYVIDMMCNKVNLEIKFQQISYNLGKVVHRKKARPPVVSSCLLCDRELMGILGHTIAKRASGNKPNLNTITLPAYLAGLSVSQSNWDAKLHFKLG